MKNKTLIRDVIHDILRNRVYIDFSINPRNCHFFMADIIEAAFALSPMRIIGVSYTCSPYMYRALYAGGKRWTASMRLGRPNNRRRVYCLRRRKATTRKVVVNLLHPSSKRPMGVIIATVAYTTRIMHLS